MLKQLSKFTHRPALGEKSTAKFWDDEHISKGMLEAHLHPEWDSATRNHRFVDRSVDWIAGLLPPDSHPALLDLGCGPGLYAERFFQKGYRVTGVDISPRSLAHARQSAGEKGLDIAYIEQSYLELDLCASFDVAVMIYCDYGALSAHDRQKLLPRVLRALKPGGRFIVDVFTPLFYGGRPESKSWSCHPNGGFWHPGPHLCLDAFYRYDESNAFLDQTIVVTDDGVRCYNIYDYPFTRESLCRELQSAGFERVDIYADVTGAEYLPGSKTLCAVAMKKG